MKKGIFLLLIVQLFAVGCNNDDDVNIDQISPEEKIIGTWQLFEQTENGESIPLNNCRSQTTITYTEDGIMESNLVVENQMNTEECISATVMGTWEYLEENLFDFERNGNTFQLEVTFSDNDTIKTTTQELEGEFFTFSYSKLE